MAATVSRDGRAPALVGRRVLSAKASPMASTLRREVFDMAVRSGMSEKELRTPLLKRRTMFAVLLYRKCSVLGVPDCVQKQLDEALSREGVENLIRIDVKKNPDAFELLGVTPSAPKIVLVQDDVVTPPVWLVNPRLEQQTPAIENWIRDLRAVGSLPKLKNQP